MSLLLLYALLGPGLVAFLGFRLCWPVDKPALPLLILQLSLALGWGLGASSAGCFLCYALAGPAGVVYRSTELILLLLAACALGLGLRSRSPTMPQPGPAQAPPRSLLARFCLVVLLLQGAVFLFGFLSLALREPHGGWDAYAFWNQRARVIFRAGSSWTDAFSPLNSHPDYPLCLPAAIVRCWTYVGRETLLAPNLLGFLFTLCLFFTLVSSLSILRGGTAGLLAGITLLSTRSFLWWGSAQYADVPLAFTFLGTVALLILAGRSERSGFLWLLAGSMSGLALWTKNEGLFFVPIVVGSYFLVHWRPRWAAVGREIGIFFLGLAPFLLVFVFFKVRFAPPNTLIAGQSLQASVSRLTDLSRYAAVGAAFAREGLGLGTGMICVLAVYGFLLGAGPRSFWRDGAFVVLVVSLVLLAYSLVFVTTPRDLSWHLSTSGDRLLLQLWPVALLAFFLLVATPEEVHARTRLEAPPRPSRNPFSPRSTGARA